MKRLILLAAFALFALTSSAQEQSLYIIGEFSKLSGGAKSDGLWRYGWKGDDEFFIVNTAVGYTMKFYHSSAPGLEHVVLDLPILSLKLSGNEVVEASELLKFKTADDAYRWMLFHKQKGTNLIIIDRNEFYKSHPSRSKPNRMKGTEVWIWYNDIPSRLHTSDAKIVQKMDDGASWKTQSWFALDLTRL
ncbi:MAG: hypothetical protein IJX65_07700 [Alistipes sp.]|nr:hypothetical protein [Alistipes sp.]